MRCRLFVLLGCMFLAGCANHAYHATVSHPTAQRMVRTLPEYGRLTSLPWPAIRAEVPLKKGQRSSAVPAIRARLAVLGDLPRGHAQSGERYDDALVSAVKQFQWRHGLKSDGVLGEATLDALNVPPKQRLQQLVRNLKRWEKFPHGVGSRYMRVNIPSYALDVVEDDQKIMSMRVIAGKPSRETPELYSKVQTIVLNPKWNLPKTIVQRDVIPGMIANPNWLAEHNIKVFSSWQKDAYEIDPKTINWEAMQHQPFPYKLTQPAGENNPLGRIKFVFLNDEDIYLHDTPQKGLFNQIRRAFSSGCLRVEEPFRLVEYFLKDNEEWDHDRVVEHLGSHEMKYIRIKNPIPIYITYITAWVDKAGYVHFREDIYQREAAS